MNLVVTPNKFANGIKISVLIYNAMPSKRNQSAVQKQVVSGVKIDAQIDIDVMISKQIQLVKIMDAIGTVTIV